MCPSGIDIAARTKQAEEACRELIVNQPGTKGISASLNIDMRSYVESFQSKDEVSHKVYRDYLRATVFGISGADLWVNTKQAAFDAAIAKGEATEEDRATFEASPANTYLMDSFVEVVKNTMDAVKDDYYDGNGTGIAQLNLSIDMSSPGRTEVKIIDNGSGFPPDFVEKMSTEEGKKEYLSTIGSPKQKLTSDFDKKLELESFGGGGWGVRHLLAKAEGCEIVRTREEPIDTGKVDENGNKITKIKLFTVLEQKYVKPTVSELKFSNNPELGRGAIITLTTSTAPLQEIAPDASSNPSIPKAHSAGAAADADADALGKKENPSPTSTIQLGAPRKRKKEKAAAQTKEEDSRQTTTDMKQAIQNLRVDDSSKEEKSNSTPKGP